MVDFAPEQSRAARALLAWSQYDLADRAKVAQKTIADFEMENTAPRESTLTSLRQALERAGVEFIPENGGGVGVRLRRPRKKR